MMAFLAISLTIMSCGKDEPEPMEPDPMDMEVSFEELIGLIAEANNLLAGAEEGFDQGNYQFGAIAQLQGVTDNAQTVVDSNTDDMLLVDNAVSQLKAAIDAFRATEVLSVATPWIQQIPNNRLLLTDSDNGTQGNLLALIEAGRDFTIELRFNPVSLQNLGFSKVTALGKIVIELMQVLL